MSSANPDRKMRKDTLIKLLRTLNTMLNANGEYLELLLIGGANMTIIQESRGSTHDFDTYTQQKEMVEKYRHLVCGVVKGLNHKWLNSAGDMFVTPQILADAYLYVDFGNLKIYSPTDKALLALKICSGRRGKFPDLKDSAFLIKKLGIREVSQIQVIVNYYKPGWWNQFGYHAKFAQDAILLTYNKK